MRLTCLALAVWLSGTAPCPAQAVAATPPAAQPALQLLVDGMTRLAKGDLEGARQRFEEAVARGQSERNAALEGGGHYGLAKIFLRKTDYAGARGALERALPLYRQAGERLYLARALIDRGYVAWMAGDREAAEPLYREAIGLFEAVGEVREQASALYNLAFVMTPGDEQTVVLQQALDLSRRLGDRRLEGLVLHRWGDREFTDGDLAAAGERLEQAAALLRESKARPELARVLTSLGRLHRVHGQPDVAIGLYQQALALQQELGDRAGVIQSVDAMAVAYQAGHNLAEAKASYEKALALARELNTPALVGRQLAHLATTYVAMEEYARAIELLDEAARLNPNSSSHYHQLSEAYYGLGHYQDAVAAADKALAGASGIATPNPEARANALYLRARAFERLGRSAEAIADARASIEEIERIRTHLVANDDMRRDYAMRHRERFDFLIDLLYRGGEAGAALEVAEQGRARAFLDLLATRRLRPSKTAGGALQSLVAAPAFSLAQISAAGARLQSTLLCYWVGRRATYVWVVPPDQPIRAARIDITPDRLEKLVPRGAEAASGLTLLSRGGEGVPARASGTDWRALHDLLIRPVRAWLPQRTGARLTVVPHGPLFRVSFAAMRDEKGRYLLERYSLHYVPAASVLDFTATRKARTASLPTRYLLVADPAGLPPSPDGRPLPRLPGTRLEVRAIARRAPRGSVTLLTGEQASEAAVRAQAADKTIIHLATHGIISDEAPFESFLALGGKGRLTAQQIYGLDLTADLVVLSACRSGLGRLSGDGLVGFTRAFFYAGTPSIVATLWDVADEPTQRLVSAFYQALGRRADKAGALRSAQLNLLGALRRGEVKAQTPLGPVTLPENPVFWAAFVLEGEY